MSSTFRIGARLHAVKTKRRMNRKAQRREGGGGLGDFAARDNRVKPTKILRVFASSCSILSLREYYAIAGAMGWPLSVMAMGRPTGDMASSCGSRPRSVAHVASRSGTPYGRADDLLAARVGRAEDAGLRAAARERARPRLRVVIAPFVAVDARRAPEVAQPQRRASTRGARADRDP